MPTPKQFDDALREKWTKLANSGEVDLKLKHALCVASPIDIYGDGVVTFCRSCGTKLWIRPWLKKIADDYEMIIMCPPCGFSVDGEGVRGQITCDFAAVESHVEKENGPP